MNELTDEQIAEILWAAKDWDKDDLGMADAVRTAIAADRALQASHIAVLATDDWKLAPLEPTAEMLQAGQDTPVSESDEDAPEDYKAVYRAMLAAAPRHHQAARVPMTDVQADDVCQNRTLRGGVLIDLVRDVEKHHGIGSESQQIAEPSSQAAAKGDACGGCGETDGNKRCLGCMHPFTMNDPREEALSVLDGAYITDSDQDRQIATLTAERDHWKANHDAQVQRARLLIERTDMPVERVKAYEVVTALTAERDDLRTKIAIIRQDSNREFEDYRIERDQLRVALLDIARLKTEGDALRKDAERYRFVVGSTDHSVAKWHDCEGWYAIEEVDLDADMQAQAVKSS